MWGSYTHTCLEPQQLPLHTRREKRGPKPGTETPNPDPRAETLYINIYKPEGGTQGGSYAFARFEPEPAYAFKTAGSSNMVLLLTGERPEPNERLSSPICFNTRGGTTVPVCR